jgi:hypothetical protein
MFSLRTLGSSLVAGGLLLFACGHDELLSSADGGLASGGLAGASGSALQGGSGGGISAAGGAGSGGAGSGGVGSGGAGSGGAAGNADSAAGGHAGGLLDGALDALADGDGPLDPLWDGKAIAPDFHLLDVNTASKSYGQSVSPRDYLGQVSAWYFGHAT